MSLIANPVEIIHQPFINHNPELDAGKVETLSVIKIGDLILSPSFYLPKAENYDWSTTKVTTFGQKALYFSIELIKISAVAAGIFLFITIVLPCSETAFAVVFIAPIFEEILFRGILLSALEYAFDASDYLTGTIPTKTMEKTREVFRVRLSAVIFGLAHLLNPQRSLIQVTLATIGGLSFGYLKVKTDSLVPGIILHAVCNGTVEVITAYPSLLLPGTLIYFANEVIGYTWAVAPAL